MSEATQRKLAAIVSADVVGYSRLMGVDEAGTLIAMRAHRAELIDEKIAEHGGRIVKTMGDGLLLEFPSVVNATQCMLEMQLEMAARNQDIDEDQRIIYRVGVNLGDIIVKDDDIFGDGVNIASRLQEAAQPGGITISDRVHDDVRDRLEARFIDDGQQRFKNIVHPVHVWQWSPVASHTEGDRHTGKSAGEIEPTHAKPKLKWAGGLIALAGAIGAFAVFGFLNPDSSTAQSELSKSDEVKPVKTATLVRETKPAAFTQPAPDIAPARPTPDPIPKINTELRIPRLNILERHAPAGRSCIDVSFGKTQAELRAVPLDQSNHLKTSSGPALCGLVLRIELGPDETYTLANLEVMAGSLVGNLRPPPGLSGRRPVAGRHDWIVDLPHRTRDAVRYRLSLTTSKSIIRGSTPSGDSNTISVLHKILPKIPG